MARYGRSPLRDLFDDAPTPHIAHPPLTHHRDYYVATDGSFSEHGGGIGAIIETGTGDCLVRLAQHDDAPDNNVAEYHALHIGLTALATHAPPTARIGVLVDHNDLAANVNRHALGMTDPDWPAQPIPIPPASKHYWDEIREQIATYPDIRAACLQSDQNPAHVLANAPDAYKHVNNDIAPDRPAFARDWEIPPPSRATRHADD